MENKLKIYEVEFQCGMFEYTMCFYCQIVINAITW